MERTIKFTMIYDATIVATIEEFNRCTNFFLNLGFDVQTHDKRKLQSLGYQNARKMLRLRELGDTEETRLPVPILWAQPRC